MYLNDRNESTLVYQQPLCNHPITVVLYTYHPYTSQSGAMIPATPFVPSRLGEGYGEESLLLAQEPIFEDQSFVDNSFWTSTPKAGQGSRQRLPSVGSEWNDTVGDTGEAPAAGSLVSTPLIGHEFEEIQHTGRGERRTWADEDRSEASSSFTKRAASSPRSNPGKRRESYKPVPLAT